MERSKYISMLMFSGVLFGSSSSCYASSGAKEVVDWIDESNLQPNKSENDRLDRSKNIIVVDSVNDSGLQNQDTADEEVFQLKEELKDQGDKEEIAELEEEHRLEALRRRLMAEFHVHYRRQGIENIGDNHLEIVLANGESLMLERGENGSLVQEGEVDGIEGKNIVSNNKTLIYSLFRSFISLLFFKEPQKLADLILQYPGLVNICFRNDGQPYEDDESFLSDLRKINEFLCKKASYCEIEEDIVKALLRMWGLENYRVVIVYPDREFGKGFSIDGFVYFDKRQEAIQREMFGAAGLQGQEVPTINEPLAEPNMENLRNTVFIYRLPNRGNFMPYVRNEGNHHQVFDGFEKIEDGYGYADLRNEFAVKFVYGIHQEYVDDFIVDEELKDRILNFFDEECLQQWRRDYSSERVMVISKEQETEKLYFSTYEDYLKSNREDPAKPEKFSVAYVSRKINWTE